MKVYFENVGRDRKTFAASVDDFCHRELLRLVRPYYVAKCRVRDDN